MDAGAAGGDGRRRGKKNRHRRRSKNRGGRGGQPERYMPEPLRDDSSILGSRPLRPTGQQERRPARAPADGPPDAFALFCAYHLGITPDDSYAKPQVDEIARRYGLTVDALRNLLREHGLDEEAVRRARFDIEGARLDIRVAPEGISRTEIARELYETFLETRQQ